MMAVTPAGFFSSVPVWPDAVAGETEAARDFTGSKAFLFLRSQRIIWNVLEVAGSLPVMLTILMGSWRSLLQLQVTKFVQSFVQAYCPEPPRGLQGLQVAPESTERWNGNGCCVLAASYQTRPIASLNNILSPLEKLIPLPGTGISAILQVSALLAF